jgi:hypothetical protein
LILSLRLGRFEIGWYGPWMWKLGRDSMGSYLYLGKLTITW